MFERIVVPLDGSELAESVLGQVRRILFRKDAEVILVRAVSVPRGSEGDCPELRGILEAQAAKYLGKIAGALGAQGARVRTVTRVGAPAEVILNVAEEEGASLVAMSTHGRSGITRWTLGSVAEKVLRSSRVPVLAVRSLAGPALAQASELSLGKILVPIDASDLSLQVVPPALELATLFGSQVALLHVCEGQTCQVPVPQITEVYERLRCAGLSVEPILKQGDPALQILETGREVNADLIAMTTHGRVGSSRWLLGSVTEKVLHAASVPLLVVRPVKVSAPPKQKPRQAERVGV